MNRIAFALIVQSLLVPLATTANSQTTAPAVITVTAQAEVRIPADRATLIVAVDTRASTAAAAAAENARLDNAVLAVLKGAGVESSQISSAGYSVRQDWRYDSDRRPKANGYVAQNAIRVEITKLDRIGVYVDTALAAGATSASDIRFSATSTEQARRSALATAMASARGDAEVIAKAAGGTLGRMLEASNDRLEPLPREMPGSAYIRIRGIGGGEETTTIMAREIIVSVIVATRWRVEFP